MKPIFISLLSVLFVTYGNGQDRKLVGVFRDIDPIAITYVEFKADSTVIVKRLLMDSFETKRAFIDSGTWRMVKDSVVLNLTCGLEDRHSFSIRHKQLVYLIKNENALYTHRYKTGKFATDGIFKHARKLSRLQERFLPEYRNLN